VGRIVEGKPRCRRATGGAIDDVASTSEAYKELDRSVNQFTLRDRNSLHLHRVGDWLCCARTRDAMVERDFTEREDRVAFLWLSAVTIMLVFAFILTTP
jgi:hypothetical protein